MKVDTGVNISAKTTAFVCGFDLLRSMGENYAVHLLNDIFYRMGGELFLPTLLSGQNYIVQEEKQLQHVTSC